MPLSFCLTRNYPNPFNATTVIEYALPKECMVNLAIFNISGQRIKSLVNKYQQAGYKNVLWEDKNDEGREVSSGIYFYMLEAGIFNEVRKLVLLK